MTHDQRIDAFVRSVDQRLKSRERTWKRLRSILRQCGWEKKSEQNLARIQAALEEQGIFPNPGLSMRRLPDDQIWFSRTRSVGVPMEFAGEDHLRDFIMLNFANIDAFSDLHRPKKEFLLPDGSFIDILARSRTDDAFVVIELKKSTGDIVGQLTKYLLAVR